MVFYKKIRECLKNRKLPFLKETCKEVSCLIDNVFKLSDFKSVLDREGGRAEDVRMCIRRKVIDKMFMEYEFSVVLTALILRDTCPIILRCEAAKETFSPDDKDNLKKWEEQARETIKKELGFIPIQGYWSIN